jgi:glycosyltransferase involved in cell wall biosynthesis
MPRISVIIPCYNQGAWLDEAVDSVLSQSYRDFEIIIVNDGSNDEQTISLLSGYDKPLTRVIHTPNQGLAMARNNGIREAAGTYLLTLDADDRIGPAYMEKAVAVLDREPATGIVYCQAETFGAVNGPWFAAPYTLRRMLMGNLIFCAAFFRKSAWEAVGGYDRAMVAGYEDWDFWLSLIEQGAQVHRIPEVHFFYRVKQVSMATSMDWRKKTDMHHLIIQRHQKLYGNNLGQLLELYYRITCSTPYRLLKKIGLPRWLSRISGGRW